MEKYSSERFTFNSMRGNDTSCDSLAYWLALVDSIENAILKKDHLLAYQYDFEEQVDNPMDLNDGHLPAGFSPLTPVMLVKEWSPIGALLEKGIDPILLKNIGAGPPFGNWVGFWNPQKVRAAPLISSCESDGELFWSLFSLASDRASRSQRLVCIDSMVGWSYEAAIASLPKWNKSQIGQAGRLIWQRTPIKKFRRICRV